MPISEYEGFFDKLKGIFHFGGSKPTVIPRWSGSRRLWIRKTTTPTFSKSFHSRARLSFPSLGFGKQATITINGINKPKFTSIFSKSDTFKIPNFGKITQNLLQKYNVKPLPTTTPPYFPTAKHSKSSPFGKFFENLWKKGVAPALTLGISYATQRAILKAAGIKHPDYILAQQFGLPTYTPAPSSTAETAYYSQTQPPTTTTPQATPQAIPQATPQAIPQVSAITQQATQSQSRASTFSLNNKTMLFLLGGVALALLLSRR